MKQAFLEDHWSGFAVQQAQGVISDMTPDRVLVLYVGQPRLDAARGPTHLSMDRLLRMVAERNVYHVPNYVTLRHPIWAALADAIAKN